MKNGKILIFAAITTMFLVACGSTNEQSKIQSEQESYDSSNIISESKVSLDLVEMPFLETLPVPSSMLADVDYPGTIETISYKTKVYDINGDGSEEVTKQANVYLPNDYDEDRQYNVLYLMHGGGETYTYWLKQQKNTAKLLDNMFEKKYAAKCIVVAPTFYTGNSSDSMSELATDVFQYEFKNDLVPAVESEYATYASKDTSLEGLRKTREHRGFAGLSMGSMVSIRSILVGCLDICAYINSMSGGYAADDSRTQEGFDLIENAIKVKFKDYPIKYWFNHNGTNDMALNPHKHLKNMVLDELSDIFEEDVNYKWIEFPTGSHDYTSWLAGLYNCLLVFFTN